MRPAVILEEDDNLNPMRPAEFISASILIKITKVKDPETSSGRRNSGGRRLPQPHASC